MAPDLGVVDSVLESLVEEPDGSVVAHVRPKRRQRQRCGICGQRCPLYDQGEGRRWWRGLDLGTTRFVVEAAAPRVSCRQHGVVVARVPWARHGSRFLRAFEDQVAWLATQCSQKACSQLMRLDWETVGRIIARMVDGPRARSTVWTACSGSASTRSVGVEERGDSRRRSREWSAGLGGRRP